MVKHTLHVTVQCSPVFMRLSSVHYCSVFATVQCSPLFMRLFSVLHCSCACSVFSTVHAPVRCSPLYMRLLSVPHCTCACSVFPTVHAPVRCSQKGRDKYHRGITKIITNKTEKIVSQLFSFLTFLNLFNTEELTPFQILILDIPNFILCQYK